MEEKESGGLASWKSVCIFLLKAIGAISLCFGRRGTVFNEHSWSWWWGAQNVFGLFHSTAMCGRVAINKQASIMFTRKKREFL